MSKACYCASELGQYRGNKSEKGRKIRRFDGHLMFFADIRTAFSP
jgi:hypothetical protein